MSKVAYLLPGQGAQAIGMGKGFYDRFQESRDIYKQANSTLGFDITGLCFEGSPDELTKTEKCQPALFVTSVAAFSAFNRIAPSVIAVGAAGLSLGELTALAVADALKFKDALRLVQVRGDAMADCTAHQKGEMLAVVGLAKEVVEKLCEESGASAANYNSQDQIVVSGTAEAITKVEKLAKSEGAKRAAKLDVAGAFHSPLMQPAADRFKDALLNVNIRSPRIPVISNVTGKPVQDPDEIRQLLVRQIVSPVLWEPSMRYLIQSGATHFLEFPPSRVLTALLRRIDKTVTGISIDSPEDFDKLAGAVEISIPT